MKIKFLTIALFAITNAIFAQDRTTVNATNSEISDNLDLRAVASLFGDSQNLEDFERRLNDPKLQISNLDLNNDNQVDYLRVIESVEDRTHLIIIQSVIGNDVFQDVATVEVEKDSNNKIQVQVVGDVFMYGNNYIYEPVYVQVPVFYNNFWVTNYRPYYSSWRWNYYPTHFVAWNPFPIYRYRHNVGLCININYQYNYVNIRRNHIAYNNYYSRRCNGYEKQYPNRSFASRNIGHNNRYELEQSRPKSRDVAYTNTRNENSRGTSGNTSRNESSSNDKVRSNSGNTSRNESSSNDKVRSNSGNTSRNESNSNDKVRSNSGNTSRNESSSNDKVRSNSGNTSRNESSSNDKVRSNSGNTSRNESSSNDRVRSNSGNTSRSESIRSNSGTSRSSSAQNSQRQESSSVNSGGSRR